MPQSLAKVVVHVVFSTKNREPLIDEAIERELHAYLAGVCKNLGCSAYQIGGIEDHVHLACSLSRTVSLADLVQEVKQSSSKWIKTKGETYRGFAWQNGYGAFSVGQSQLDALKMYIASQREHHRRESFQDEFRMILARHDVSFDEQHVWY